MRSEPSILVLGDHSAAMASLAERARRLGYRTVRAKTAPDALALAQERGFRFRVVLIRPDFPALDLRSALEAIRSDAGSEDLIAIAAGEQPLDVDRDRLRSSGVRMALWEPVGDHALRFQLNRAMDGGHVSMPRGQERVPTEWGATVFMAGREKPASVYSLSCGGSFLETRRPSQTGVEVAVELGIPGRPVSVSGRVIYTNVPGNLERQSLPHGMAVRFQRLDEDASRSILHSVVESAARFVV